MKEYLPILQIELAHNGRQYERINLKDVGDIGWADGYADLENDRENINKEIDQRDIEDEEKEYYIERYEEGYNHGKFMSENASDIYDENGQLKEGEYDL